MKKDFFYYASLILGLIVGNIIGEWIFDSIKPQVVKEKVTTIQADTCAKDTVRDTLLIYQE